MLRQVAPLLVADEALVVPHVLCSFTRRQIYFVHIHGIRIPGRSGSPRVLGQRNITISPTLEFPESYHILIELSCLIKPLFPFPASLFLSVREGGSGHHDSKLVSHPSLEGIHQGAVQVNSAAYLSQSKGGGVLVEVTIELVHAKRVDCLASSILDILQDEGFFKGST